MWEKRKNVSGVNPFSVLAVSSRWLHRTHELAETYQIAVWCLFEYFIHTKRRQFIIVSIILFNSDSPQQSIFSFFSFVFLFFDKSSSRKKISPRLLSAATQIVLNSKHDVYYIARFRKRAPVLFVTMRHQNASAVDLIVVNLFILMSKWYGWQAVYIVRML